MSLFSNFFNSKPEQEVVFADEGEAIYAIIFAVANVDGRATDSELSQMIKILGADPVFGEVNWGTLLMATKKKALEAGGSSAMVKPAIERLSIDSKLMAFIYAVDIVIADGEIGVKEEELLRELRHGLDVEEDVAVAIMKALIYKLKTR
jgi:uncharacterized tellurite resistance protein B-like protein